MCPSFSVSGKEHTLCCQLGIWGHGHSRNCETCYTSQHTRIYPPKSQSSEWMPPLFQPILCSTTNLETLLFKHIPRPPTSLHTLQDDPDCGPPSLTSGLGASPISPPLCSPDKHHSDPEPQAELSFAQTSYWVPPPQNANAMLGHTL